MNGRVEPNRIVAVGNGHGARSPGSEPPSQRPTPPSHRSPIPHLSVDEVSERARQAANIGKDQVAERIAHLGTAFKRTGEALRDEEQAALSHYAETIGERIESAAHHLRDRPISELAHDVENFARREPAIFFGGAFLLGFVAARFLKSSAREEEIELEIEPELDFGTGIR